MDELTKIFKENQKYADTLSKDPELAADKIKEDIDKYQQMLDDVEGFEYGGYEFTEYAGMHWMIILNLLKVISMSMKIEEI